MEATLVGQGNWSIPIGAPVYDVEGAKLGTLAGTDGYTLFVEEGLLMITTHPISMGLVASYDDGGLYLSVTKDDAFATNDSAED